jgi:hypothetical protein
VIVRISTDGQYRLPDGCVERLNSLDDQAQEAVEAADDGRFQQVLAQMIELVRSDGEELDDDELVESSIILPPPESTIAEVGEQFHGEGLIPD